VPQHKHAHTHKHTHTHARARARARTWVGGLHVGAHKREPLPRGRDVVRVGAAEHVHVGPPLQLLLREDDLAAGRVVGVWDGVALRGCGSSNEAGVGRGAQGCVECGACEEQCLQPSTRWPRCWCLGWGGSAQQQQQRGRPGAREELRLHASTRWPRCWCPGWGGSAQQQQQRGRHGACEEQCLQPSTRWPRCWCLGWGGSAQQQQQRGRHGACEEQCLQPSTRWPRCWCLGWGGAAQQQQQQCGRCGAALCPRPTRPALPRTSLTQAQVCARNPRRTGTACTTSLLGRTLPCGVVAPAPLWQGQQLRRGKY